ncbi:MAG: asparaginase [Euryarchaeota archaeon]|nr:asparaginase [Euryarchaeota archaeon]
MSLTVSLPRTQGLVLPGSDRETATIWVEVTRGPLVESRHEVHGMLWVGDDGPDAGHLSASWGDPSFVTYLRSSLKPIQVLPLLIDKVAAEKGLTDDEVAIAIGSHSGQDTHVEAVRSLMAKTGVTEPMLQCGRHPPFHKETRKRLAGAHTVLHNNCSGKHAAMVAWALAHGHDPDGYLLPDHPVQRRIIVLTAMLSGIPEENLAIGVDGCGVPTIGMPLWAMARLFWLLADPQRFTETDAAGSVHPDEHAHIVSALGRARDCMMTRPFMIGGEERPDTDLTEVTGGRLIAKAGAEGLWCGADVATGTGFAFKAADGNFRAVVPAALEALLSAGLLSVDEAVRLEKHRIPNVENHTGDVVGRVFAVLPEP